MDKARRMKAFKVYCTDTLTLGVFFGPTLTLNDEISFWTGGRGG